MVKYDYIEIAKCEWVSAGINPFESLSFMKTEM